MEQNENPVATLNIEPDSSSENTSKEITLIHLFKNFFWLWIQPNRFFINVNAKLTSIAVVLCVYLMGISAVADRIDINIMRTYSGGRSNEFIMNLTTNWISYWGFVLGAGVLAAGIAWLFWGWIFNLRLKWSGDKDFDPTHGRVVYSITDLVLSLPYLVVMVIPVLYYPDYITYYNHDELWTSSIIIFSIWKHVTKFIVVKKQFNVMTWKACIWFLALPISILLGAVFVFTKMMGN